MKRLLVISNFTVIVILGLFLSSCENRQVQRREYKEIVITVPSPVMSSKNSQGSMKGSSSSDNELPPVTKPAIIWKAPNEWLETKGSSMRLVSFSTPSDNPQNYIECSIVSLSGKAGGVKANVMRWMSQVNLNSDQPEVDSFLNNLEKTTTGSGLPVTIVDFTILQVSDDELSSSMMAAIIELTDEIVFIKMTGDKGAVLNNKKNFQSLVQSISLNE
ncbi:hypothetical protein MNBD_UNCLBAC01-1083 [hydrothermal vent metagenome]|uniref:Uncharacterized protein n=1 Tax=hydrothermal vent metagenome TaxID=652676 RepID=A0A3B1DN13_9ZZZZ